MRHAISYDNESSRELCFLHMFPGYGELMAASRHVHTVNYPIRVLEKTKPHQFLNSICICCVFKICLKNFATADCNLSEAYLATYLNLGKCVNNKIWKDSALHII